MMVADTQEEANITVNTATSLADVDLKICCAHIRLLLGGVGEGPRGHWGDRKNLHDNLRHVTTMADNFTSRRHNLRQLCDISGSCIRAERTWAMAI